MKMKKDIKTFFNNYESDMTPDVDKDKIKNKFVFLPPLAPAKPWYSRKPSHWLLAALMVILFLLPGVFIISYINSPSYSGDPNRELSKYLYYNFDNYTTRPFTTDEVSDDLKLEFYFGEKDEEQYVIVRTISNDLYQVSINHDNQVLLTLDMNNSNIGKFLITDLVLECDIIVSANNNMIITKSIILDVSSAKNNLK